MRKILLTLTAAGVLAVPVGMVSAQDDTIAPVEPVPTCMEQDHERQRINEQDPLAVEGQAREQFQYRHQNELGTADMVGDHVHDRDQVRLQDGTADQARDRDQVRDDDACTADCTGDQVRDQDRLQDGTGSMTQDRTAAMDGVGKGAG